MENCGHKVGPFDCCSIVCGDSRELLPQVPEGYITLALTDFPYGVGLEYDKWNDTQEALSNLAKITMPEIIRIARRSAITCGVLGQWLFPRPTWVMIYLHKGGASYGPYGFTCWQPILCYGKDKYLSENMGRHPDFLDIIPDPPEERKTIHPCPKPLKAWKNLAKRMLAKTDGADIKRILDPFLGSGTTALVAESLGLHWLGFELSERYCQEANERLKRFRAQGSLFP